MRTILHSDVNNFFASVECATRPELVGKAVAVTGNPEKRTGIILAKNEIAKKAGVKTGQTIYEALQICPELVCLAPHYSKYEEISKRLHEVYLEYSDLVEPLGLDECWIDVTSTQKILHKSGEQIANELRARIKKEFGFTVSVGVSFSKIFAKLGSDLKKPDATTIIAKDKFKEITYHLPLDSIVGIGKRLEKKFRLINVHTIGEFCALDKEFIRSLMGITGVRLLDNLRGSEEEPVQNYFTLTPPKSIGNGTTTIKDIKSRAEIEKVLSFLAEKVSKRLISGGFAAKTISVTLKSSTLEKFRKSQTFNPTFASDVLLSHAMEIVDSFFAYNCSLRALRLRASNLEKVDKARQLSFFDQKEEKKAIGIQKITQKYGSDAIYRASEAESFINRKNHTEE